MANIEIEKTKRWLEQVIVGFNFCPFAKKELVNNTIHYQVSNANDINTAVEELLECTEHLATNDDIETSLVIYRSGFAEFYDYLDLIDEANYKLSKSGYDGIFQLASFHPNYCFEGEGYEDAANFTNRSPLPTIHIIREASLEKVLKNYKKPEDIPVNNMELARAKGNQFFIDLLAKINNN